MINSKLPLVLLLLIVVLFETVLSDAEIRKKSATNEVLAIGTASIVSGNLALAKKSAISRALMKGVENYLVHRLGSQGVVNNFQRFIEEIIPGAKEEIENFNILTETQFGNEYKVLVRLKVNEKVIDKKLREAGLIFMEGPPIKVLFLVSEVKDETIFYWWKDPEVHSALSPTELALNKVFQKRGFSSINRSLSAPVTEFSKALKSPTLEEADVLKWGKLFSSDVVIYGQANIVDEKEVSLTLNAFNVNQGLQICQDFQVEQIEKGLEANGQIIETLERLVDHLAERLTPIIVRTVRFDHEKVHQFEITLKDLDSLKRFRIFRDFLRKDVIGVRSVRQTRVRKNSISIAVEFQGERNRFMDSVLNHENLPFPLNVVHTKEGEILLRIE
jgi:hypothetical protein